MAYMCSVEFEIVVCMADLFYECRNGQASSASVRSLIISLWKQFIGNGNGTEIRNSGGPKQILAQSFKITSLINIYRQLLVPFSRSYNVFLL